MAQDIVLPQWGMEMQDGTIIRWLKQEGDPIQEGEPLVEVETAKISTELESTASGVVAHILVAEGNTVPIRTVCRGQTIWGCGHVSFCSTSYCGCIGCRSGSATGGASGPPPGTGAGHCTS